MARSNKTRILYLILSIHISILSVGCSPSTDNHGYIQKTEDEQKVIPGITQEEVQRLLGTPSTVSNYGNEKWYYISKKTESVAFFEPKVLEQRTFVVEFTDGMVTNAGWQDPKNYNKIEFVKETTPTEGSKMGIFEQLIGNLGRFNSNRTGRVNPNPGDNY